MLQRIEEDPPCSRSPRCLGSVLRALGRAVRPRDCCPVRVSVPAIVSFMQATFLTAPRLQGHRKAKQGSEDEVRFGNGRVRDRDGGQRGQCATQSSKQPATACPRNSSKFSKLGLYLGKSQHAHKQSQACTTAKLHIAMATRSHKVLKAREVT